MSTIYPIHFPGQLRQHLRALRKKRGLTQAQVGALVGVSQARIAEIEANPGTVSLEKLMQLLSALGVTVSLGEAPTVLAATQNENVDAATVVGLARELDATDDGEQISNGVEANSTLEKMREANSALEQLRQAGDAHKLAEQMRNLIFHSKKGSW